MTMPASSRVYVDSNIWTDLVFKKKDPDGKFEHRDRSTRDFMTDVMNKRYIGVVTTLVIHETVVSCRRLLADKKGSPPSPDEVQSLEKDVRKAIDKFGVEIRDADILASPGNTLEPLFARAFSISIESGIHQGYEKNWQYVSGMDSIHACLAERSQVQFFATHDKAIRHLVSSVKPAYLEDEYP